MNKWQLGVWVSLLFLCLSLAVNVFLIKDNTIKNKTIGEYKAIDILVNENILEYRNYYFYEKKKPDSFDNMLFYAEKNIFSLKLIECIEYYNLAVPTQNGPNIDKIKEKAYLKISDFGKIYQKSWDEEIFCLQSSIDESCSDIDFLDYFAKENFYQDVVFKRILNICEKYKFDIEDFIQLTKDNNQLKKSKNDSNLKSNIATSIGKFKEIINEYNAKNERR